MAQQTPTSNNIILSFMANSTSTTFSTRIYVSIKTKFTPIVLLTRKKNLKSCVSFIQNEVTSVLNQNYTLYNSYYTVQAKAIATVLMKKSHVFLCVPHFLIPYGYASVLLMLASTLVNLLFN